MDWTRCGLEKVSTTTTTTKRIEWVENDAVQVLLGFTGFYWVSIASLIGLVVHGLEWLKKWVKIRVFIGFPWLGVGLIALDSLWVREVKKQSISFDFVSLRWPWVRMG